VMCDVQRGKDLSLDERRSLSIRCMGVGGRTRAVEWESMVMLGVAMGGR
jgi:hypothetical protein